MKRVISVIGFMMLFWSVMGEAAYAIEDVFSFSSFGRVVLYRQSTLPSHVVIFVSGDGGWNKGVVDMARTLSYLDAAVAGVDIIHYLKTAQSSGGQCLYPAGDFEELSKFIQKRMGLPRYTAPVLVGYSSGATLVYGALAQAPPTTFLGVISMGFCPDIETTKPFCRGNGLESNKMARGKGFDFLPAQHLKSPWIAFQGTIDQVCSVNATQAFVKKVPNGEIVLLPKVGHGFSVERNWMPQFREAFARLVRVKKTEERKDELKDLPLVEIRAAKDDSGSMAVIISGDGGWAGIDRDLGEHLSQNGLSVVGLNSLQYFWSARSPSAAGADLERIIRHYLVTWHKDRVILIGYSFGADVLPFMADELSPDLRKKIQLIAFLGLDRTAEFEFHVTDWIGQTSQEATRPVLPMLHNLRGIRALCFYGSEERESLCRGIDSSLATPVELKGSHHFGGDYRIIAETILKAADSVGTKKAN
jgi:type IV secretory pathway VirJ component